MSARRPAPASGAVTDLMATCGICHWDTAVRIATPNAELAICRRPACEFEAFHLHPGARLAPLATALEVEL